MAKTYWVMCCFPVCLCVCLYLANNIVHQCNLFILEQRTLFTFKIKRMQGVNIDSRAHDTPSWRWPIISMQYWLKSATWALHRDFLVTNKEMWNKYYFLDACSINHRKPELCTSCNLHCSLQSFSRMNQTKGIKTRKTKLN